MSFDLNRVLLTGRLGRKPELKTSVNGTPYARMSVAIHGPGGKTKEAMTQWHSVMVWGNQAASCAQYLNKGSAVLVEGYLENREYLVQGVKRYGIHVNASRVQFLGGRSSDHELESAERELDNTVSQIPDDEFDDS